MIKVMKPVQRETMFSRKGSERTQTDRERQREPTYNFAFEVKKKWKKNQWNKVKTEIGRKE